MATEAASQQRTAGTTRRRRRRKTPDPEQLKILRLDLHTIMAQIKLLDREMEQDPCLSPQALATILSLVESLKQQLEEVRGRIRELKVAIAP